MRSFMADVRYGLRLLLGSPGFSLAAIASLSIGIGANTAIFSFISALLLRPLPLDRPAELVALYTSDFSGPAFGSSSYPDYQEFRDKTTVFSGVAAHSGFGATVTYGGRSERAAGSLATGNFFRVLGLQAATGRTFGPEEDGPPRGQAVAVLSDRFWQRLGAPAGIVGEQMIVNGQPCTVIGVTVPSFTGLQSGRPPDFWVPSTLIGDVLSGSSPLTQRSSRRWGVIGRLAAGTTLQQAQAAFGVLAGQMAQSYPNAWLDLRREPRRITLVPAGRVAPGVRGAVVGFMSLLMAVAGLVLLIACANVANLLLARAAARRREVAVRLSIGAGRGRLVRQLLTESVLLSLVAGAVGLLLAFWGVGAIAALRTPVPLPISLDATIDSRVLLFTVLLSVATGVLFGIVPALQSTRAELVPALKSDAMLTTRRRLNLGQALIVLQVSLSLLLLVTAGLLVRTLQAAQRIDLGFVPDRVAIVSIDLTGTGLTRERGTAAYRAILDRLRQLPDVEQVSLAAAVPLGPISRQGMQPEGYQARPGEDTEQHFNFVTPDYFETMGIPIVAGRGFTDRDDVKAPAVAMVNEAFGRRFWPGQNPVGKRIGVGGPNGVVEVVGVTGDGRYVDVLAEPMPYVFFALWQNNLGGATIHVRTQSAQTAPAIALIRDAIRATQPGVPVFNEARLADQIDVALMPQRLAASWVGSFGAVALLLAAIGLYGVLAHAVSLRHREIGVRMALGADPRAIHRLFVVQGMRVVLIGLAAGLAGSLAIGRPISALLYGVSAADPTTLAGMTALLCATAFGATYFPARRAARLDPIRALRQD